MTQFYTWRQTPLNTCLITMTLQHLQTSCYERGKIYKVKVFIADILCGSCYHVAERWRNLRKEEESSFTVTTPTAIDIIFSINSASSMRTITEVVSKMHLMFLLTERAVPKYRGFASFQESFSPFVCEGRRRHLFGDFALTRAAKVREQLSNWAF